MVRALIRAKNLRKSYQGRAVVAEIDFEVRAGECFGMLGPNGAGKTTTLRLITGLTPLEGGELFLFEAHADRNRGEAHRRIGVVPQEDNLDDDLTVAENLLVYGRYFGLSDRAARERINPLLEVAQLSERRDHAVRTLSGGMKRRLVIARALVNEPELLILDEPTTGLDPQARHLIWQRLAALKNQGTTLFLTTHYMEEAARLCDRLMIIDQGRILAMDSPAALIRAHVEPEVVEIRGLGAPLDPDAFSHLPGRLERVGDALHCHSDDGAEVISRLRGRHELVCLSRPASLEDVFLRLTGRELRD
ncbi:Lipooligosaccharide transport system ATP-binding [Candidatus Magnetaquicoccaceae bacterium FCR-1]|uniref:Lipooligosaccharide transport system ATP-binding n=2 Tax=Candidatus Magnetaquiglobus chichijimensis TaxID=3141448 RepID=A0ABQ0CD51_9PROT